MKRSFRFHLFIHISIATVVVIYSNRLISQSILTSQLNASIHQEMAVALSQCSQALNQRENFLMCALQANHGSLTSKASDHYVFCHDAECPEADANQATWMRVLSTAEGARIESAEMRVAGESWLAVRQVGAEKRTQIMLKQSEATAFTQQIWNLRDRVLVYTLPSLLFSLAAMTFYLIRIVLRPTEALRESLSGLSSSNLGESRSLSTKFREFQGLVDVFEDLRQRLNDSFIKARRFAADASHELKTPLTILRGNAERLIAELPVGSEAQVRMRQIGEEVERLIDITEKLLLLSRADANSIVHEKVPVDLSALLTQMAEDSESFQSDLKITSDIQAGIQWRCDQRLIQQLIQNLYVNAVNYNVPHGWIHMQLTQANGLFTFSIENPSRSVPQDLGHHAFERFYRGDSAHNRKVDGQGLGLSLCLEIAKLHQATLTLAVTEKNTVKLSLSASLESAVT